MKSSLPAYFSAFLIIYFNNLFTASENAPNLANPLDCKCSKPFCNISSVSTPGPGPCKCPVCVMPELGGKCYNSSFAGHPTCGNVFTCCNGICQRGACTECHEPCGEPYCTSKSIYVYGPKPCRCIYCVEPEPGHMCYKSFDGTPTCGEELTNLTCNNGICQRVPQICNCPPASCPREGVLVSGQEPCKCPTCVIPEPGGECLKPYNGTQTCGTNLKCCNGLCQDISKPCGQSCNCLPIHCTEGVVVPGQEPCRCPTCVIPEPGDKCIKSQNEILTCGTKLSCCQGFCQESSKPCEGTCQCPKSYCDPENSIFIPGPGPCKCPICVKPEPGDKCYYESFTSIITCGGKLTCCNGKCQNEPCDRCDKCGHLYCTSKSIKVFSPRPCRCPFCIEPVPGGPCFESFEGNPTCGEEYPNLTNLACCNGVCVDIANNPCRDSCFCHQANCYGDAVIVAGPEPCKCPKCQIPEPGNNCQETLEVDFVCGTDLVCCDGWCRKNGTC